MQLNLLLSAGILANEISDHSCRFLISLTYSVEFPNVFSQPKDKTLLISLSPADTAAQSWECELKPPFYVFMVDSLPFLLIWNIVILLLLLSLHSCAFQPHQLAPHQRMTWWTPQCVTQSFSAEERRVPLSSQGTSCECLTAPSVPGAQGKRNTLTLGKAGAFLPAGVWHDLASLTHNLPLPVWWPETPKSV